MLKLQVGGGNQQQQQQQQQLELCCSQLKANLFACSYKTTSIKE